MIAGAFLVGGTVPPTVQRFNKLPDSRAKPRISLDRMSRIEVEVQCEHVDAEFA
jgi:hypothetical protein